VATGRSNKLVGQVGEFLICAELGRRGLIATPFAGNVPRFDVIATDEDCNTVPIQVKTNNGTGSWQCSGDKFLDIEYDAKTTVQTVVGQRPLPDPDTIWALVWLGHRQNKDDRFFVMMHRDFQRLVHEHHVAYLRQHNGIRPKAPESRHVAISLQELKPCEDAWHLVADQLKKRRLGRET